MGRGGMGSDWKGRGGGGGMVGGVAGVPPVSAFALERSVTSAILQPLQYSTGGLQHHGGQATALLRDTKF